MKAANWAEGRIDYAKALGRFRIAVTLDPENTDYLYAAGEMARTLARYPDAKRWLERLLAIQQEKNPNSIDLAYVQHDLAWLYHDMGEYAKAEPLYQRSLTIREKALGKDHPLVAATLNNLAGLYRAQGEYAKAEPLYQRSLTIKEKALGKDHP